MKRLIQKLFPFFFSSKKVKKVFSEVDYSAFDRQSNHGYTTAGEAVENSTSVQMGKTADKPDGNEATRFNSIKEVLQLDYISEGQKAGYNGYPQELGIQTLVAEIKAAIQKEQKEIQRKVEELEFSLQKGLSLEHPSIYEKWEKKRNQLTRIFNDFQKELELVDGQKGISEVPIAKYKQGYAIGRFHFGEQTFFKKEID